MKVKECRDAYQDYSGVAGQIVRQAGYAGIAMIWALKDSNTNMAFSLKIGGLFFFIALFFDFMTYVICAWIWGIYAYVKEKTVSETKSFKAPEIINWPYIVLSTCRYLFTIAGYMVVCIHLIKWSKIFCY